MKILTALLVVGVAFMIHGDELMTSLGEMEKMSDTDFKNGRHFRIQGHVLSVFDFERSWGQNGTFVLSDGTTRALLTQTPELTKLPRLGDIVIAEGRTYLNIWNERKLNVLSWTKVGSSPLPAPVRLSCQEIRQEYARFRRVTVTGTIEEISRDEADKKWYYIVLWTDEGRLFLTIPETELRNRRTPADLVDAKVCATGLCLHNSSGQRIHIGPLIALASVDDLKIVAPPPSNRFDALPLHSEPRLDSTTIDAAGPRSVKGYVIAVWDKRRLLVVDRNKKTCSVDLTEDAKLPAQGDFIHVVGYPVTDFFRLGLTRGIWRMGEADFPLPPEPTTPVDVHKLFTLPSAVSSYNTSMHGRRIQLSGTISRLHTSEHGQSLILGCDSHEVQVVACQGVTSFGKFDTGSRISASGILFFESEMWKHGSGFPHITGCTLLITQDRDIVLIHRPPWWTAPGRLLSVIAALIAALVGIIAWNRTLNRLVNRRSRQILKEQIARERAILKVGERNRLAIELHDSLSQNLAAIACQVSATRSGLAVGPGETARNLETVERMLLSSRTELKRCLQDLRNDALDEPDMTTALKKALSPIAGHVQLQVRFNVPRIRLDDTTAHAIICVVRELVSNAIRHGRASNIRVAGDLADNILSFSVRDDGCGFLPENRADTTTGHFGLDGIRERAERMNAVFSIESSERNGTRARFSLTLPDTDGKELPT